MDNKKPILVIHPHSVMCDALKNAMGSKYEVIGLIRVTGIDGDRDIISGIDYQGKKLSLSIRSFGAALVGCRLGKGNITHENAVAIISSLRTMIPCIGISYSSNRSLAEAGTCASCSLPDCSLEKLFETMNMVINPVV